MLKVTHLLLYSEVTYNPPIRVEVLGIVTVFRILFEFNKKGALRFPATKLLSIRLYKGDPIVFEFRVVKWFEKRKKTRNLMTGV